MRHRPTALACALTATLGLVALPASGARADSSVPLTQLAGFHQIVADSAKGYLFLSEGVNGESLVTGGANAAAGSAIVVTDLSGNYVTTLDTGKGVEGLALSSDGGTLYAALAEDDAVGVIDTATLTQTAEYSLGSAVAAPYSLAIQGGKLWVGYNGTPAGSAGEGAIGDLDLSAASPALETQGPTVGWSAAPDLAADPDDTGVLVAAEPDGSPVTAAAYSVSADPVTQTIKAPSLADCDDYGVAVFPGGTSFMVCGNTYSTATMSSQAGGYVASDLANAISPDGSLDVLGSASAAYVYQAGSGVPVNRFGFGGTESLAPAGLAFSADDARLYAVLENTGGTAYSLQVFGNPATARSTLTLTGTSDVHIGSPVTLNGSLQLSTGSPPAGTQVSITRTQAGGTGLAGMTATTAADGTFTLTDTPAATGTYTYTASYPGSAAIEPASATFTASVTVTGSFLTLTAPPTVIAGAQFTLTGALGVDSGSPPSGAVVDITRTVAGSAPAHLTAVTTAGGGFTLTQKITALGTYAYAASYAGDAGTAPTTVTVKVTVKLTQTILVMNGPSARVLRGKSFTLGGILVLEPGGHPAAGTPVTITRTKTGTSTARFTVKTDGHGDFTYTSNLGSPGTYRFTGRYAGDTSTSPATGWVAVTVQLPIPVVRLSTSANSIRYDGTVKVTAHLGTTYTNRTLAIYAQTAGSRAARLLKRGWADARGNLTVSYTAAHSTMFTASFSGDAHYAAAGATRTVGVSVRVAMTDSGYFGTKEIAGITYRVYHHTGDLGANVTITPDKSGQCVNLEVQQWDSKGKLWFANATIGCLALNKSSKVSTDLTLLQAAGAQYRVRADYARGRGDATNLNTDGSWFYFEVVK